jgi:hypothetical protein
MYFHDIETIFFGMFVYLDNNIYVWKHVYLLDYYYSLIVSWILLVVVYIYDEWIEWIELI